MPQSRPDLLSFDFDERPFTVAWELTRACALACVHCRAEAEPTPDPNELTTDEALKVVDQLAALGPAVLVLTGGDPLMRRDLFEIVEYAVGRKMRVAVSPNLRRALGKAAISPPVRATSRRAKLTCPRAWPKPQSRRSGRAYDCASSNRAGPIRRKTRGRGFAFRKEMQMRRQRGS